MTFIYLYEKNKFAYKKYLRHKRKRKKFSFLDYQCIYLNISIYLQERALYIHWKEKLLHGFKNNIKHNSKLYQYHSVKYLIIFQILIPYISLLFSLSPEPTLKFSGSVTKKVFTEKSLPCFTSTSSISNSHIAILW